MIGFYCVTPFQMFLSVLLKEFYYPNQEAIMFIVPPLKHTDYNLKPLREIGFSDVIFVDRADTIEGRTVFFHTVFFFSIYCAYSGYLKALQKNKLALVYEGITSFQLKHWHSGWKRSPEESFDLDSDIDEIWLPNTDLLLDEEYLPKCRTFSFSMHDSTKWRFVCEKLNELFGYVYAPVEKASVFMDRYLFQYTDCVLNFGTEKFLTQSIYYGMGGKMVMKRHPADANYSKKYAALEKVQVIAEDVPWELIYLNGILYDPRFYVAKYIIYNSFAPANIALLFGDNSYECVCFEPLLEKYSDIQDSYLSSRITVEILDRFSKKFGVKVSYIQSMAELWGIDKAFCTDDTLWNLAEEKSLTKDYYRATLELKGFRLELDTLLVALRLRSGQYYLTADTLSTRISRQLLNAALPSFRETQNRKEADFIIDCDGSLVNYTDCDFDIRKLRTIEGCFRLRITQEESIFAGKLHGKDNIYIWGAAPTNRRTLDFLQKMELMQKLRTVFDTYTTGECRGVPIMPFSKEAVMENSIIIVCANIAHPEITKHLSDLGYKRDIDFTLGLGVGLLDEE